MPRRAKGLTAAFVDKSTRPGRYADGGGLYLLVRSKESKFWIHRSTRAGRTSEMGGGPATGRNAVGLAQARVWARSLHATIREGRDPIVERKTAIAKRDADEEKARAEAITFSQVADLYLAAHEAAWRSPQHQRQWRSSLSRYVTPIIGSTPVGAVDVGMAMKILEPLWRTRTETASRVRGRIESVLDYATARGWRSGENPARWRGHLNHLLPARSRARRVEHFPALDWREAGAFMRRLRQLNSIPAKALEFLILTAARLGEVRGARWHEIDLDHVVWTIPATRIKSGREHRTPLGESALAVLREMAQFGSRPDALVFPSARSGAAAIGDVTLTKAVRDAGEQGASVHGFRSTFRDWAGETTGYPREVIEMALAHRLGDAAEQAYARGDLLERRRRLMADWAMFCLRPAIAGEVIELKLAR